MLNFQFRLECSSDLSCNEFVWKSQCALTLITKLKLTINLKVGQELVHISFIIDISQIESAFSSSCKVCYFSFVSHVTIPSIVEEMAWVKKWF